MKPRKVLEAISSEVFVTLVTAVVSIGEGDTLSGLVRGDYIVNILTGYLVDFVLIRPDHSLEDVLLVNFLSSIPEYTSQPEFCKAFIIFASECLEQETRELPDLIDDDTSYSSSVFSHESNYVFDNSLEVLCRISQDEVLGLQLVAEYSCSRFLGIYSKLSNNIKRCRGIESQVFESSAGSSLAAIQDLSLRRLNALFGLIYLSIYKVYE